MTIDEDAFAFVVWATKLGFPSENIPSKEAIKSIFKSRQCDLFYNLMKRVQPIQVVADIRDNILIKRLEKLEDRIVPFCTRSFLPKEYQIFVKMKELKAKKSELESKIEGHKKNYDSLASSIKIKNMQHIKLTHKHEILQARVNVLDVKSFRLSKEIEQEEQNKKRIQLTIPVKLTAKNACEKTAVDAISEALRELDCFYNIYTNTSNLHALQEAKDDLWNKLRTTFRNVPNFMLFNAIMRLKDEQLQTIVTLNKSNIDDSVLNNCSMTASTASGHVPLTPFELKLMKATADLFGVVAKYLAARQEHALLEERFSDAYPQFVNELQKKINLFNVDIEETAEDIISEYIVQYNLRNHHISQNEFLGEQIEFYKTLLETGARQLEDHDVLLATIKQVYGEVNTSVNRIQQEMMQLNYTKQKILYSKNIMQQLLTDLKVSNATAVSIATAKTKSNLMASKMKLSGNNSILSVDSFELTSDVFSSTKLDFNSTISSLNATMRRSLGSSTGGDTYQYSFPPHLSELLTFKDIPLERFSCISKECSYYLSPNPLIMATQELSSTIQLSPGILLTAHGALKEVQHRIQWAESSKVFSSDLKMDLSLTLVDTHAFKTKIKQQREQIAELLDKIDVTSVNTNRTLQKATKLYEFMLENPLRNYIPATKSFNNQTYSDYESEFNMYYRMATVGASIK